MSSLPALTLANIVHFCISVSPMCVLFHQGDAGIPGELGIQGPKVNFSSVACDLFSLLFLFISVVLRLEGHNPPTCVKVPWPL